MAINYNKTSWAKGTIFNPTNMNNIENGIKAACDGVDALEGVPEALEQEILDLKYLGYTIPRECPVQNQKTDNGYVVKVGRVDLGSLNWLYRGDIALFFAPAPDNTVGVAVSGSLNTYTSRYKTAIGSWELYSDKSIGLNTSTFSTDKFVLVKDSSYNNATAFKNSLQGTYLYYELATPYILPLDGAEISNDTADLKFLGWTVPKEMPVRNYTDNIGTFHQRVGRVDLGTVDYTYVNDAFFMNALTATIKKNARGQNICYSSLYKNAGYIAVTSMANMTYEVFDNGTMYFKNASYTDATAFKSAMSGVYLYYELATEVVIAEGNEVADVLSKENLAGLNWRAYSDIVVALNANASMFAKAGNYALNARLNGGTPFFVTFGHDGTMGSGMAVGYYNKTVTTISYANGTFAYI